MSIKMLWHNWECRDVLSSGEMYNSHLLIPAKCDWKVADDWFWKWLKIKLNLSSVINTLSQHTVRHF